MLNQNPDPEATPSVTCEAGTSSHVLTARLRPGTIVVVGADPVEIKMLIPAKGKVTIKPDEEAALRKGVVFADNVTFVPAL